MRTAAPSSTFVLRASAAESLSCPGYDPKLKAELSTKFTYNIVSAIWMNNADMVVRIPLDLPRNIQKRAHLTVGPD